MCLAMAATSSGIGVTSLAVGGVALTGVGAFAYKLRENIKSIFRKVIK